MRRTAGVVALLSALALFAVPASTQHTDDHTLPNAGSAPPDLLKRLAGVWKAPEFRVDRASDLDVRVFGAGAADVRNVDLTLQPSGEGVLKISKSVIGRTGRKYAPSIIEAKLV